MSTSTDHPQLPVRHKSDSCCAPTITSNLTTTGTQGLAVRLKAIADPTRLAMLELLAQQTDPLCVCDITDKFTQNQPTISHHLKLLREAGLVACKKQGTWAFYWATSEGRKTLAAIMSLAR